jgi:hypothetical protein
MLVRIDAASGGIREYLESGRKKGREFERDLIDRRDVLDGDLDLLDAVIRAIEPVQAGAARYLHISLGFAERFSGAAVCGPGEINLDRMRQAADAYRALLMAAYGRDEYCWYAEAHIPKLTHDIHAGTGASYERLPHVHIVVPMVNLVDGRHLNPLGYGKHTLPYAQAIQEVVNARFGLKSPLDSPRSEPIQPLARHNAEFNGQSPAQLRAWLARRIADGHIASFEQLVIDARAFGEVRMRHGRDGDYINVKPSWAQKGINLKEFGPEAFAKRIQVRGLPAEADRLARFESLAAEWRECASLEARFVNAANRKHVRRLDASSREAWLAERVELAEARIRAEVSESPEHPILFKDPDHERTALQRQQLAAIPSLQSHLAAAGRGGSPATLAGVRHLSQCDLAQHARQAGLFLPADAPDGVGQDRNARRAVRRTRDGDRAADGQAPGADARTLTVAGSLRRARLATQPSSDRLKADTSPTLVLAAAARLHGIDPSLYDATTGRDGTPRIRHGDKHYNLGDFFTKHLQVPWAQARETLLDCYHQTLADGLPPPDADLWRGFGLWRERRFAQAAADKANAREELTQKITQARATYKAVKLEARAQPAGRRHALMARARAEQLLRIESAREADRAARAASALPSRNAMYREFLTEMASRGQLAALCELRRLAQPEGGLAQTVTSRTGRPVFAQPGYRVDHTGKVTYVSGDTALVTDSLKGVSVVTAAATSYALALKVAVARYGSDLTLHGDDKFITGMLAAARASGLPLTLRDGARPQAPAVQVQPDRRR